MIRKIVLWGCIAGVWAIGIVTRLQHPDMAETRLFLEFWPRWVAAFCLAAVAVWQTRER